ELMGVLRAHVEVPPAEPRAPGPFAFEDLAYLEEVLTAGGFSTMEVEPYSGQQAVGGKGATPDEAVGFVLGSLGIGRVLDEQPEAIRKAASADLKSLFESNYVEGAGPLFGCKAWLVSTTA
ncbi:MAG: SAM-dependent methyltransferase, partial [Pseudomonadota bacterium]